MIRKVFLAVSLLLCVAAASAQTGSPDGDLTGARPNEGGAPEEITVRLGVLDIAEIIDRKPGILPFDFDEEIGHKNLLAVNDFGNVQHAEPHLYHIRIAPGIGPRAAQVTIRRPGLRAGGSAAKK